MKKILIALPLSLLFLCILSNRLFSYAVCTPPTDYSSCTAQNPDVNLDNRSYQPISSGSLNLFSFDHPTDSGAPQLNTLIEGNARPAVTSLYQVNGWDWTTNSQSGPIQKPVDAPNDFATLVGFSTGGQSILVPSSGYEIGSGYEVLVLYATSDSIVLKYTAEDNVSAGYTLLLENIQVDPALLAFYNQTDQAGRTQLPALLAGERIGQAIGNEVLVALRDTGMFMDPRWSNDWWQNSNSATVISLRLKTLLVLKGQSGTLTCHAGNSGAINSRPVPCDACSLPSNQTASCAQDFKVVDQVSYEKGEAGLVCNEQRYTDEKSWGGIITIDPRNINLPFVGKQGSEDSTKYLADYFEGTNEYYKTYHTPLEKVNFTGILQKLMPMEFQDKLKKQMVERAVASTQGKPSDNSIHNYKVKYVGRTCWNLPLTYEILIALGQHFAPSFALDAFKELAEKSDYCLNEGESLASRLPLNGSTDTDKAQGIIEIYNFVMPDFLDVTYQHAGTDEVSLTELKNHLPPDTKDPDYLKKWEAWKKTDGGKWYRLWQVTPLITREDSIGSIIPRAGLKPVVDKFEVLNPKDARNVQFPHLARLYEASKIVQQTLFPKTNTTSPLSQENSVENEPVLLASNDPTLLAQGQTCYHLEAESQTYPRSDGSHEVYVTVKFYSDNGKDGDINFSVNGSESGPIYQFNIGTGNPYVFNPDKTGSPFTVVNGGTTTMNYGAKLDGPCGTWISTSCNFSVSKDGLLTTNCGGAAPVLPACGLPDAKNINSCPDRPVLPDSSGDNLCCTEIKASIVAKDQFINNEYIPCPLKGCEDRVNVEVSRPIEVGVAQPFLGEIWKNTGAKLGLFNVFRPAEQDTYTEMDAIGKTKIKYTYTSSSSLSGKTVPTDGNLYFRYLGGVQLAKEAVLRVLAPFK